MLGSRGHHGTHRHFKVDGPKTEVEVLNYSSHSRAWQNPDLSNLVYDLGCGFVQQHFLLSSFPTDFCVFQLPSFSQWPSTWSSRSWER